MLIDKKAQVGLALMFEEPPQNEKESIRYGNFLAQTGNYPVGTSDCFNIGISGGCGKDCFVYQNSDCEHSDEYLETLVSEDEIRDHYLLYPKGN